MNNDSLSSGFFGEDIAADNQAFSELKEFYVSKSGYNQLHICRRFGRRHIVKSLQPAYASQEFYKQLLIKEFNISYPLEHPNIRHTLGLERNETLGLCIVMEYVDGMSLGEFMQSGKLTRALAYKFISEICDALLYIHNKQLIHKDIKPNNILVTYNGNNIKLIDFGLADQDDYDILKIPAGTKRYLAPEQLVPHAVLDCRTDIYSLGIIIQEMADILKDKKLMAIARRCTQKMPEKRYNTTAEIKDALKKKKKIIPPVYKYSALLIIVIIGGFGLLRNGPFSNRASSSPNTYMPQPSTNVPASHIYQKALLKARIQLQQRLNHYAINEDELKQDSSELSNKLKKYLHEYFPDSTQRETVVYKQILSEIDQDIKREIKQIRQQLR